MSLPSSMSSVRSRLSAPFRVCLCHAACARSRKRSGGACAADGGSWPSGKQCSGRSRSGLMPAARMRVQPKWIYPDIRHVRLAGSGHKIFILVDRGSNPLRDANSRAGSRCIRFLPISKEAQCPQGRSAETGLKDRVAPELVTGNFLED